MAASNILIANKFQFKEVTDDAQWANVKDYRFKAGETISVYRLQQETSGSIVWDWDENRTL